MKFAFFSTKPCWTKLSQSRWRPRGNALSMACQSSVGWACGLLVSAEFWSWKDKESADFPDRFRNEKWNARAHSVRAHLQHFQSPRSYRAHSLSSVTKSSLNQLDMTSLGVVLNKASARKLPIHSNCRREIKPYCFSSYIIQLFFMKWSAMRGTGALRVSPPQFEEKCLSS